MSCIIEKCNSKSRDTTLFCIPIEKELRLKWIEAIERYQKFDHSASDPIFVCVHHFHKNDFIPGVRFKRISATTVPSIFPKKSENVPANKVVVITRVSSPKQQSNTLKRTMPPIATISKVRKVEPFPQNNVSKDPIANSLVGKKVRLNIGNLKNVSTFVSATHIQNGNTMLLNNLIPAKNPTKITDNQIRTVPKVLNNLSIKPTSAIGKKIIIVPKKNLNPPRKETCNMPVIQHVYSLQPNTSTGTPTNTSPGTPTNTSTDIPTDDNVSKKTNSVNSNERRLKVVDIDKLIQAPTSSENQIEPISVPSHQVDENCSDDCCSKCVTVKHKVNDLERTIEKLRSQNKILRNELSMEQSATEVPPNQQNNQMNIMKTSRKNQYFNENNRQCLLCRQFVEIGIADQHLCLKDQDSVQCHICDLTYKSTASFVQHLNTYHKSGQNKHTYKCDECGLQYANPVLFECHKMSHKNGVPVMHSQYEQRAMPNQQAVPANQVDTQKFVNTVFYQCAICTASFSEARLLGQHMKEVHVKGSEFKCYSCGHMFEGSSHLEAHIKKVHKNIFECTICKPKFEALQEFHLVHGIQTTTKNIDSQILNECPDVLAFECYICKLKTKRFTDLRIHMEKHARDTECKICKLPVTQSELNSHLCGKEKKISCENCDQTFTSTITLLEHLKSHEKKRLYRCHKCPKFFPMIILRHYHMIQIHDENDVKLRKYSCNICGKRFTSLSYLYVHRSNHNRNKDYLCDECGSSFYTAKHLENHKLSSIHSNEPRFKCTECPRSFFNKVHLYKHFQRHENNKYVCEICNLELKTRVSYQKHSKIHTRTEADRRYECKACPMKFFNSKGLKKHLIVHNENRPHVCQFCNVSYKYKGDLNKHMRIHLDGGKIHQCTMCPSRFYYPQELDDHIFDHYKKDKMNEEEKNGEEKEKEKSSECNSNDTLSPSVMLRPAFVHENVQLWG